MQENNSVYIQTRSESKVPVKIIGEEGKQARMFVSKFPGGRQVSRIEIDPGFDWRKSIKRKFIYLTLIKGPT